MYDRHTNVYRSADCMIACRGSILKLFAQKKEKIICMIDTGRHRARLGRAPSGRTPAHAPSPC